MPLRKIALPNNVKYGKHLSRNFCTTILECKNLISSKQQNAQVAIFYQTTE